MSFEFPENPIFNDTYSYGNKYWVWNGFAWDQLNIEANTAIIANVRSVSFELSGPGSTQPGTIAWNPQEECLDVYQPDGTVCQVGLESYIRVSNYTDSTLTEGTFVMFVGVEEPTGGSTEHTPKVAPFTANGGWGTTDDLTSPTFTLIHELRRARDKARLYHVDLYRIEKETEAWMLGLTDLMDSTASVLIEWPERAPSLLPPDRLWIKLEFLDDTRRRLSFNATDELHLELLNAFKKSAFGL